MPDDWDEEEPTVTKLHCISAMTIQLFLEVMIPEFTSGTNSMFHVEALLTHQSPDADGRGSMLLPVSWSSGVRTNIWEQTR